MSMGKKDMESRHQPICNRLKALRLHTGLSQEEFAKEIGARSGTYSSWETGKRISPDFMIKACERFGVTTDYFYRNSFELIEDSKAMSLTAILRDIENK